MKITWMSRVSVSGKIEIELPSWIWDVFHYVRLLFGLRGSIVLRTHINISPNIEVTQYFSMIRWQVWSWVKVLIHLCPSQFQFKCSWVHDERLTKFKNKRLRSFMFRVLWRNLTTCSDAIQGELVLKVVTDDGSLKHKFRILKGRQSIKTPPKRHFTLHLTS